MNWGELHSVWAQASLDQKMSRADWQQMALGTQLVNQTETLEVGATEVAQWMGQVGIPWTLDALTAVAGTAHFVQQLVRTQGVGGPQLLMVNLGHLLGSAGAAIYQAGLDPDTQPPAMTLLDALEAIADGADPIPTATRALSDVGYAHHNQGDN